MAMTPWPVEASHEIRRGVIDNLEAIEAVWRLREVSSWLGV